MYLKAEEALKRNQVAPAIEVLDELIKLRYESNLQIAHRWAHSPPLTPMTLQCDPVVAWKYLKLLREGLTVSPFSESNVFTPPQQT